MSHFYILHWAKRLPYSLIMYKGESIVIYCYPDCTVLVKAPIGCSYDAIKRCLRSRAVKIVRQFSHYKKFFPSRSSLKYVSGEKHLYLGRAYNMQVLQSNIEFFKVKNGEMRVGISKTSDVARIRKLLNEWYLTKARKYFSERLASIAIDCGILCDIPLVVNFKRFKHYVCNKYNRNLIFAVHLIQISPKCIDYVIYHAICHMFIDAHDSSFYKKLVGFMPDIIGDFFKI